MERLGPLQIGRLAHNRRLHRKASVQSAPRGAYGSAAPVAQLFRLLESFETLEGLVQFTVGALTPSAIEISSAIIAT